MESWKPIPELEEYEISDFGNVRRLVAAKTRKAKTKLSPRLLNGYLRVSFRRDGNTVSRFVHCLVLRAFVGPIPPGKESSHIDGDPTNNHLSNLRYDTPKGNAADKRRHGTHPSGEHNGNAVLSIEDVLFIKHVYKRYSRTHGSAPLAKQFGVTQECVLNAATGRSWATT